MERPVPVATGVPQLDLILGGGIVQRSVMLLAGQAGSGKTVLASQIACTAAARGERILFITAFSEPHNKLIANLRSFSFFKPDYLGDHIKLLNLQHQLLLSLEEAADTLVREAREHHAQMVIIDGFQGIVVSSTTTVAPHQFLFDLSAKLSLLDVTTLITYDLPPGHEAAHPELTAVDGVINLTQELVGDQVIRTLQVLKQRGSNPLLGRHSFKITDDGFVCYPRQESVMPVRDVEPGAGRVPFGIAALDGMLGGGLNRGTTTIVAGAEGVGKTLLGLQYLMQGAAQGERGLQITFHETAQQLIGKGLSFGLDAAAAIRDGQLIIHHYSPAELNPDEVAQRLRDALREHQIQRLVIDGLNEIERPLIERGRAHGFFASLLTLLRTEQTTACITLEIDPVIGRELSFAGKNMSALADNIVLMRYGEANQRSTQTITVLKMRFSNHDRLPHEYSISPSGLDVAPQPLPSLRGRGRRGD